MGNVIGALTTGAGITKIGNYINGRVKVKELVDLATSKLKPLGLGSTGRTVAKKSCRTIGDKGDYGW